MTSHHALPPHTHLTPSTPISSATALANIQAYLSLTADHAYLHPDVIFTSSGPTASNNLAEGGLVLHQLRRVEAGLRGEHMEVELAELERMRSRSATPAFDTDGARISNDKRLDSLMVGEGVGRNAEEEIGEEEVEDDYRRKLGRAGEGVVEGEVGARSNVVGNVDHIPNVQATQQSKKRPYEEDPSGPMDKDAKRRAKKARLQEEKARRQSERMAGKELDEDNSQRKSRLDNDGDVDMNVVDNEDDLDQSTYQGDEINIAQPDKALPNTPDVLRANVLNDAGDAPNGDVERSGVDGSVQKKKKKKSRKSESMSKPDVGEDAVVTNGQKKDLDTELNQDSVQKVSKMEKMEGRTPVKGEGTVAGDVKPPTSPLPGTKADDKETAKKNKAARREQQKQNKRKGQVVEV